MIEIKPATLNHIPLIADRLLEKSRICNLFPLWNTRHIIKSNLLMSCEAYTAFLDGEAACMYGLHTPDLISGQAMPWMMATDSVKKARVAFYRMAKDYVNDISGRYRILEGGVDVNFDKSQRWLEWLGFKMGETKNDMRMFRYG